MPLLVTLKPLPDTAAAKGSLFLLLLLSRAACSHSHVATLGCLFPLLPLAAPSCLLLLWPLAALGCLLLLSLPAASVCLLLHSHRCLTLDLKEGAMQLTVRVAATASMTELPPE
eukprot:g42463.t1